MTCHVPTHLLRAEDMAEDCVPIQLRARIRKRFRLIEISLMPPRAERLGQRFHARRPLSVPLQPCCHGGKECSQSGLRVAFTDTGGAGELLDNLRIGEKILKIHRGGLSREGTRRIDLESTRAEDGGRSARAPTRIHTRTAISPILAWDRQAFHLSHLDHII